MSEPTTGLRERSKARRRATIQRTAMRMFAERGYDATTVAEIADAAEVAPRTVSMYFPTKADLALSWSDDMGARFAAVFAAHSDANLLEVLDLWLAEEERVHDSELASLAWAMFRANPELRAVSRVRLAKEMEIGASRFARLLGLPVGHPMFNLAGAALGAAIDEYLAVMADQGWNTDLHRSFLRFLEGIVQTAVAAAEHL